MAMMHALGIDVETTRTNPADDAVVELAAVGLRFDPVTGDHDHFCKVYRTIFDPGRATPPEASAVVGRLAHHPGGMPPGGAPAYQSLRGCRWANIGGLWSDLPDDYCRWIVEKAATGSNPPFDPVVVATAQAALRGVFAAPVKLPPPDGEDPAGR